jgi:hypothetical protein
MTRITCNDVRAAALDPGTVPGDWARRPDAAAHIEECPSCRDWLEALATGEQAWAAEPADRFAAQVIARTAGVEAVVRDLPLLSDMDPGPGFAERVLMATSRKPAPERWRARVAGAWWAMVRRPRFAWEAAYVATVCWVLVFGNPVGAIEWSATSFRAVARERLGPPVNDLRADLEAWRGRLAPGPAAPGGEAAGARIEPVPPVVRAWEAATNWLRGLTASVVHAIALAWERVTSWSEPRAGGRPAAPGEPPADAARSPQ